MVAGCELLTQGRLDLLGGILVEKLDGAQVQQVHGRCGRAAASAMTFTQYNPEHAYSTAL